MTTSTTITRRHGGYLERPTPSGLAEVVDLILDKGLVIDLYVRVALVGIELLTIDARIVVASVDTYLRFAEAVNRLDLTENGPKGLPDLLGSITESGARHKTRGALAGVRETAREVVGPRRLGWQRRRPPPHACAPAGGRRMSAGRLGSRRRSASRLSVRRRGVATEPVYVYGIVLAGAPVPEELHGIGDAQVHVVTHDSRRCPDKPPALIPAAGHSGRPARACAGDRSDLPVVPGTPDAVRRRAGGPGRDSAGLLEPNSDTFAAALDRIDNHEQFILKGRYQNGAAYAEVLAEQPQIARMSAWLRERDAEAHRLRGNPAGQPGRARAGAEAASGHGRS